MAETITNPGGGTPSAEELAKMQERLTYLESESKKAFDERDKQKARVRELEEAEQKRKEADLTEIEKAKQEADRLKKELETATEKAKKLDAYEATRREAIKAELGDKWDDEFASMPLTALEKVAAKLAQAKPAGAPPPGSGADELPKTWEEALRDSRKFEALDKYPELKEKLKREHEAKRRG